MGHFYFFAAPKKNVLVHTSWKHTLLALIKEGGDGHL